MTGTVHTDVAAPARPVRPVRTRNGERLPRILLIAVGIAYAVAMIVVVAPHTTLSWDESVYASQYNPHGPAMFFSAPRARGVPFLVAPLVMLTDSMVWLRVYLAVVAGIMLVVAFWPWLRLQRRPAAVPLAALLFAGLWLVMFYGAAAMPNAWVAFAAVAATGWFGRYGQDGRAGALVGFGIALAWCVVVRPLDAFWITIPMIVAMIGVRRWRRPWPWAVTVLAVGVGMAQWLVESFQRFGGPVARLARADAIEGGLGWHPEAIVYQAHTLIGPSLCRPCHATLAGVVAPPLVVFRLWWFVLPVFAVAGLVVAWRHRRFAALAVATASGATIGLAYLLLVGYSAPRFLIPTYALLALPVATFLVWLPDAVPVRFKTVTVAVIAVAVVLQLSSQMFVLVHRIAGNDNGVKWDSAVVALRNLGIRQPCVVMGRDSVPMAYRMNCAAVSLTSTDNPLPAVQRDRLLHRDRAVYLSQSARAPATFSGWRRHALPTVAHVKPWYAYTPPWQP